TECSIPIIAKELVGRGVVSNKNIRPTVLIVIEDDNAESFAVGAVDPDLLGYVGQNSISEIAEQLRAIGRIIGGTTVALVDLVVGAGFIRFFRPLGVMA